MKSFASLRPGSVHRSIILFTFLFLITFFFASSLFAQWGLDTRLTYDPAVSSTSFNHNAWCVAANGNSVHVVWFDFRDGHQEIYYKRSTDGGVVWTPDYRLSHTSGTTKDAEQPAVAVSGSNVYVVWEDFRSQNYEIYYAYSTDNGSNWTTDNRLSDADGITSQNPSIAASGQNVHVVWEDNRDHGYNTGVYYKVSTNGGTIWGPDTRLTYGLNRGATYPCVAASGQYVHVAWQDDRNSNWEIYYKHNSGSGWTTDTRLTNDNHNSASPSVGVSGPSGQFVNVVWHDDRTGSINLRYIRSTTWGGSWGFDTPLSAAGSYSSAFPSVATSGSQVHVVWQDSRDGTGYSHVYYNSSADNGGSWAGDTRLSDLGSIQSEYPSVGASNSNVHVVWRDDRQLNYEIFYKRNPPVNGFYGYQTEPSQGRHLVREPGNPNNLHLVMKREDNKIFYAKSTDNGGTWSPPLYRGDGQYPTVGLVQLPLGFPINYYYICVAYKPSGTTNRLYYQFFNPLTGQWTGDLGLDTSPVDPGPPSMITDGWTNVYLAYQGSGGEVYCRWFPYNNPGASTVEVIDENTTCSQPCLGVDGNGRVYAAWKKQGSGNDTQIWYAPRQSQQIPPPPPWDPSTRERIDQTTDPSQQPFIECYGDSVFVVWSDDQPLAPSDVWQAKRQLVFPPPLWVYKNVSQSSLVSESPTQAFREFATWSEGTSNAQPDIWYWSPNTNWGKGDVQPNTGSWSYWPHSQMTYWFDASGTHADLWSAWTESITQNSGPFTVFTKHLTFNPPPSPPPGGGSPGSYYGVQAGQNTPSPYCRLRDGVLRFADKAVDFARDSLVYELPYLSPNYDYYVKVVSYRETGPNWAEAISLNGQALRTVQFALNTVDTAWVKLPWVLYKDTRKVTFTAKNVRGDYVTCLGLTLYQVDPGSGGGGGPQTGALVGPPLQEVFAVYPNPMSAQTRIEYSLKAPGLVNLSVYDVAGRLVREVVNGTQPAGMYQAAWDGKGQDGRTASSGIYFVKLLYPEKNKTARLVLIR